MKETESAAKQIETIRRAYPDALNVAVEAEERGEPIPERELGPFSQDVDLILRDMERQGARRENLSFTWAEYLAVLALLEVADAVQWQERFAPKTSDPEISLLDMLGQFAIQAMECVTWAEALQRKATNSDGREIMADLMRSRGQAGKDSRWSGNRALKAKVQQIARERYRELSGKQTANRIWDPVRGDVTDIERELLRGATPEDTLQRWILEDRRTNKPKLSK